MRTPARGVVRSIGVGGEEGVDDIMTTYLSRTGRNS